MRQGWAEAKSKLGKLMYKGRYSCLYRRESTTRWGDVYHERPVHGHKAVHHVKKVVFRGRKILLECRIQEGCRKSTARHLSRRVRIYLLHNKCSGICNICNYKEINS